LSKSERGKIVKELDSLLFQILCKERGKMCELCGRTIGVGTFHILPKGSHPKLRYAQINCLLACWLPCHQSWHKDYFKAKAIDKKIRQIVGQDYEEKLIKIEVMQPRHDMTYLKTLLHAFKEILK